MIQKGDFIAGDWRCTYASPFRYDFRKADEKGVGACVYQSLTNRKWVVYYSPNSSNRTLLRAVLKQIGALPSCSTRAVSSLNTSSI